MKQTTRAAGAQGLRLSLAATVAVLAISASAAQASTFIEGGSLLISSTTYADTARPRPWWPARASCRARRPTRP